MNLLKKVVRSVLRPLRTQKSGQTKKIDTSGYTLYEYTRPDGSFDYELYRRIQTEGNRKKIGKVWAREENITFLAEYIRKMKPDLEFGICHGTRRGKEQEWFAKTLNCDVIGTEISDTATMFPKTIQWDFHNTKTEWIDNVDFIYSNSFDHTYAPEQCLNAWMSCVKPGGLCFLEHTLQHTSSGTSELDPFGADLILMPYLITTWGQGRYYVREILRTPQNLSSRAASALDPKCHFIVIQRSPSDTPASPRLKRCG